MDIGTAIRVARTRRGLTQRELALRLKVSITYLSLLERNRRDPSLGLLERLAIALEVPLPLLFLMAEEGNNRSDRTRSLVVEQLFGMLLPKGTQE
jgi:transcriptional regulator with XRE-family HTH domain